MIQFFLSRPLKLLLQSPGTKYEVHLHLWIIVHWNHSRGHVKIMIIETLTHVPAFGQCIQC
jgi:hypothetical protein